MTYTSVLGFACFVLGVSFAWPQVLRVYRVKSVEGISTRGQLHALAGGCLWTVYGFARLIPPMLASNTVILTTMMLVNIAMVRHHKMRAAQLIAVFVGFLSFGIGMTFISVSITAWFAIVVGATSIIPQAVHVVRHPDLSGVSVGMYGLLSLNGVVWTAYAFAIHDMLLAAPNAIMIPCAALITTKAWSYQRRTAPASQTVAHALASDDVSRVVGMPDDTPPEFVTA